MVTHFQETFCTLQIIPSNQIPPLPRHPSKKCRGRLKIHATLNVVVWCGDMVGQVFTHFHVNFVTTWFLAHLIYIKWSKTNDNYVTSNSFIVFWLVGTLHFAPNSCFHVTYSPKKVDFSDKILSGQKIGTSAPADHNGYDFIADGCCAPQTIPL